MSEDVTPYGAPENAAMYKSAEDLKRTAELRSLIESLGVSQRAAARMLEVDERTMRYWIANNPAPPIMALYAMRYLVDVERAQTKHQEVTSVGNALASGDKNCLAPKRNALAPEQNALAGEPGRSRKDSR